ncbi:MAG: class I SAM-dependent methyltransferase [Acidobacteria bacterium]|nr:class I SAM-dependent methyltransferase [Acidobacteriota bacterium]
MRRWTWVVAVLIALAFAHGAVAQAPPDRDAAWSAFIAWFKTSPAVANPLAAYAGKLKGDGRSEEKIRWELGVIAGLLAERSDWIGVYFDKVYAGPLTGDPARDRFSALPSAFLAGSIKGLKPGAALDAGMGQGRNAVYLAQRGWTVTGFDISDEALAAARVNAAKVGVRLTTVNASYDTFDFGTDRWDLIVLAFAWAPVTDPAFIARLRTSLRPGGKVVFEHFIENAERPQPNVIRALKPNQLRVCFSEFLIESYEEADGIGDWGGPGSRLVRMVAEKR